jgi:hypothetical protein
MRQVTLSSTTAGTALILATILALPLRAQVTGRTRDLRCRGKPGIDIWIYQESSPRTPKLVTMVLRYERPRETRALGQVGMGTVDYGVSLQLVPGSCTWRYDGAKDIPFEPGIVYFDIPRDAQAWTAPGARDTTIDVAMNFADVGSITRYLNDSTRYWGFYVDDVTNVSISFGPRGRPAPPIAFGAGPRDATAGARTRSGAHTSADSTTNRPATLRGSTTVRSSTAGDKVSASLRGNSPAPSANPGAGTLPNDSAKRSAGATRTPTPSPATAGTIGGLRDGSTSAAAPPRTREMPTDSATNPSSNAAAIGTRRLSNVRTVPGPLGVIIKFDVMIGTIWNRGSRVGARISSQPPVRDEKTRTWSYDWLQTLFSADVRELDGFSFEAVPTRRLEAGRRYYYLIDVNVTPPEQRTGSFTAEILNPVKKPSK